MIPLRLTICGFGPHSNTVIDFESLRSPIALCASFGTGKTFLMEGVYAALYGRFCWYQGSIYDALTQGDGGEGNIELVFVHAGERYVAARTIKDTGKTRTQRAELFNELSVAVAGPKVGDFERAIESLIGSADTALSTWFLSQNRSMDLCGQPCEADLVARRREVFNELIGANELDQICDEASQRSRDMNAIVMELEAQLTGEPNYECEIENSQAELIYATKNVAIARHQLAEVEIRLEEIRRAIRDTEGDDGVLLAKISEHSQAEKFQSDLSSRLAPLRGEIASLNNRASGLDVAKEQAIARDGYLAEREKLRLQSTAFAHYDRWMRRRVDLQIAVASASKLIATLKAQPGVDDATRDLAAQLDQIVSEYREKKTANEAVAQRNANLASRRTEINNELAALGREKTSIEERISKKPAVLFGEKCLPCPLMVEFSGLNSKLESVTDRFSNLRQELRSIPEDEVLGDLQELIQRGADARAAVDAVQHSEAGRKQLTAVEAELAAAQHLIDEHEMQPPDQADDPSPILATIEREIDRLSGAADRVDACGHAKRYAELKESELHELSDQLTAAKKNEESTREAANIASATLENRELERAGLRRKESFHVGEIDCFRGALEASIGKISSIEAGMADLRRRQKESIEKRVRLDGLRSRLEGLKDVRQALGPRGVRQILIDNAAPELEAIADDLFERATEGKMRLRIATQTVNSDGSIKEDFQIMVTDERGERDALRYSGGQLQLIQILFRISVALWVGQMRGQRPDCLFLDEAFDRLGSEGTDDLLRVLEFLGDHISFIMVVTHDGDIADRLASQIRLRRNVMGVSVEIIGQAAA